MKAAVVFVSTMVFAGFAHANLDDFIKKYNGVKPKVLGPNCYATALSATTGMKYFGNLGKEEFQLILNSPLCTEKSVESNLEKGDLIVVKHTRMRFGQIYAGIPHVSVYLDEKTVFEKPDYSKSTTPQVIDVVSSLSPYTAKSFSEIRKFSDEANVTEGTWALVYNCKSLDFYISEHHADWRKAHKRFWEKKWLLEYNWLEQWTQKGVGNVESMSALPRRLFAIEGEITRSLARRHSSLMLENELSKRDERWLDLPEWVSYLMLKRIQSMNRQTQLLVSEKVNPQEVPEAPPTSLFSDPTKN